MLNKTLFKLTFAHNKHGFGNELGGIKHFKRVVQQRFPPDQPELLRGWDVRPQACATGWKDSNDPSRNGCHTCSMPIACGVNAQGCTNVPSLKTALRVSLAKAAQICNFDYHFNTVRVGLRCYLWQSSNAPKRQSTQQPRLWILMGWEETPLTRKTNFKRQ